MSSDNLPTWDEMTDLDKGAALLHCRKRRVEGAAYAVAEYPARYFDHPALLALHEEDASEHAATVARGKHRSLPFAEYARLYDGALDEERRRYRERQAAKSEAVSDGS